MNVHVFSLILPLPQVTDAKLRIKETTLGHEISYCSTEMTHILIEMVPIGKGNQVMHF
jgi:hypothetical protein